MRQPDSNKVRARLQKKTDRKRVKQWPQKNITRKMPIQKYKTNRNKRFVEGQKGKSAQLKNSLEGLQKTTVTTRSKNENLLDVVGFEQKKNQKNISAKKSVKTGKRVTVEHQLSDQLPNKKKRGLNALVLESIGRQEEAEAEKPKQKVRVLRSSKIQKLSNQQYKSDNHQSKQKTITEEKAIEQKPRAESASEKKPASKPQLIHSEDDERIQELNPKKLTRSARNASSPKLANSVLQQTPVLHSQPKFNDDKKAQKARKTKEKQIQICSLSRQSQVVRAKVETGIHSPQNNQCQLRVKSVGEKKPDSSRQTIAVQNSIRQEQSLESPLKISQGVKIEEERSSGSTPKPEEAESQQAVIPEHEADLGEDNSDSRRWLKTQQREKRLREIQRMKKQIQTKFVERILSGEPSEFSEKSGSESQRLKRKSSSEKGEIQPQGNESSFAKKVSEENSEVGFGGEKISQTGKSEQKKFQETRKGEEADFSRANQEDSSHCDSLSEQLAGTLLKEEAKLTQFVKKQNRQSDLNEENQTMKNATELSNIGRSEPSPPNQGQASNLHKSQGDSLSPENFKLQSEDLLDSPRDQSSNWLSKQKAVQSQPFKRQQNENPLVASSEKDDFENFLQSRENESEGQKSKKSSKMTKTKSVKKAKSKQRKVRTTITQKKLRDMNYAFQHFHTKKQAGKSNQSLKEIGKQLGLGYSTILHKYRQFRNAKVVKGGALIQSLTKKRKYKKSEITESYITKATEEEPFFTAVELSYYIKQKYGMSYSRSIISRHLGEMGFSYKNLKKGKSSASLAFDKMVQLNVFSSVILKTIEVKDQYYCVVEIFVLNQGQKSFEVQMSKCKKNGGLPEMSSKNDHKFHLALERPSCEHQHHLVGNANLITITLIADRSGYFKYLVSKGPYEGETFSYRLGKLVKMVKSRSPQSLKEAPGKRESGSPFAAEESQAKHATEDDFLSQYLNSGSKADRAQDSIWSENQTEDAALQSQAAESPIHLVLDETKVRVPRNVKTCNSVSLNQEFQHENCRIWYCPNHSPSGNKRKRLNCLHNFINDRIVPFIERYNNPPNYTPSEDFPSISEALQCDFGAETSTGRVNERAHPARSQEKKYEHLLKQKYQQVDRCCQKLIKQLDQFLGQEAEKAQDIRAYFQESENELYDLHHSMRERYKSYEANQDSLKNEDQSSAKQLAKIKADSHSEFNYYNGSQNELSGHQEGSLLKRESDFGQSVRRSSSVKWERPTHESKEKNEYKVGSETDSFFDDIGMSPPGSPRIRPQQERHTDSKEEVGRAEENQAKKESKCAKVEEDEGMLLLSQRDPNELDDFSLPDSVDSVLRRDEDLSMYMHESHQMNEESDILNQFFL